MTTFFILIFIITPDLIICFDSRGARRFQGIFLFATQTKSLPGAENRLQLSSPAVDICRDESIRAVSSQFLAKWSVSSRYCLSPQGEFIGCSSHEPRIAETARKLDCRQISTAVSGTAVSGIAAKEVSNGRPVRTTQGI